MYSTSVNLKYSISIGPAVRYNSSPHHSVPPSVERHGGKIPSLNEDYFT